MTNATNATVVATTEVAAEVNVLLAAIERGGTEQLQVAIKSFKGKKYLDLRIFYTTDKGNTYLPTKKGVTVSPKGLLQVRDAVDKAMEQLLTEDETK